MSTLAISSEVSDVLRRSTITGNLLVLPAQLERPLYEAVNKVLLNAGGLWSKRQKGHLFSDDPSVRLGLALNTGAIENKVDDATARKKEYQAFYTPPALAKRLVELAQIQPGNVVLEPSAGEGAIVQAVIDTGVRLGGLTAVELDEEAMPVLIKVVEGREAVVYNEDFLHLPLRRGDFDRILMNPPFSRNQDVAHVARALPLLAPGGVLVAVMSPNTARQKFQDLIFAHDYDVEEVPAGTFKEAGTNIATIILTIRNP